MAILADACRNRVLISISKKDQLVCDICEIRYTVKFESYNFSNDSASIDMFPYTVFAIRQSKLLTVLFFNLSTKCM